MLRSYLSFYMLITFVRSFHIFAFFLLLSDCKITTYCNKYNYIFYFLKVLFLY